MYEVIVIGKGLFGSSAVRYMSELADKVAIIGPDEPADPAAHRGVFGAHYDEGRLTYQLKSDNVWAGLARASLARFPAIEAASGIRFHSPVGHLYLASERMDNGRFEAFLMQSHREAGDAKEIIKKFDGNGLREEFPYLSAAGDCWGLWEGPPAGYFSPRRFLRAQMALAAGVTAVHDVATGVAVEEDGVLVTTERSGRFRAKKVLVAAGAYSNGFGLLERPLSLRLKQEYVIRAALPGTEVSRLREMPPIVYRIDHPRLSELYILPPIQYPDGRYYLKMGANTVLDKFVEDVEAINGWYREGNSDAMLDEMREVVLAIFPGLKVESWRTHRCVITRTAHKRPYIDAIVPGRVYAAVGGNGQGAKAADEVGRLAARLVLLGEEPGNAFTAVYRE
ncbi:MAG: FAD-binding oxidoreductase [Candidatus Promineifilaceae bacterium]